MPLLEFLSAALDVTVVVVVAGVCIVSVLLSCLSISGTWLISLAAIVAVLSGRAGDSGWWMVLVFLVISILVELAEALAGSLGVTARGGSKQAGWAAFGGGILGLFIGGAIIPVPLLGSVVGMCIASFLCVFAVESRRLKRNAQAASIAWGAVLGRIFVILLKVVVALALSLYLLSAMID